MANLKQFKILEEDRKYLNETTPRGKPMYMRIHEMIEKERAEKARKE